MANRNTSPLESIAPDRFRRPGGDAALSIGQAGHAISFFQEGSFGRAEHTPTAPIIRPPPASFFDTWRPHSAASS
jgi:hypothetical protein